MDQSERVTLKELANELGVSVSTVSRALQNSPRLSSVTKQRVLRLAAGRGYLPNLAARFLVSKRGLKIGVISPREIASFYDLVRRGLNDEASSFLGAGVQLQHYTFPLPREGETDAFEQALSAGVDGIIVVPGDLPAIGKSFRKASRLGIPVVCLVSDAPEFTRLASVGVNTRSIASIAATLMGRFLGGKGRVAITTGDFRIADHAQKYDYFRQQIQGYFPALEILPPIENHDRSNEAYSSVRDFLSRYPDVEGLYISTGTGAPVLSALEDANLLGRITVISTSLFEAAIPHIRSGAIAAALYERPYSQGRSAFRLMYEYLALGKLPPTRVSFEPLLILDSNLDSLLTGVRDGRAVAQATDSRALVDELVLFDGNQR